MRKEIGQSVRVLVLLVILGTAGYPALSNAWNTYVTENFLLVSYDAVIVQIQQDNEVQEELDRAKTYNQTLAASGISIKTDSAQLALEDTWYQELLNPKGTGMMGYIDIPCISVLLPIYHGTAEEVLESGVGHLYGSSLPVGGESTHAILAGHSGLPSAELFTDLEQIEEGDVFTIHVMGESLTYEVYEIQTVLPQETESLVIREGEDLCTLITCTPYGINTHRLLVTGRRKEETENESSETSKTDVSTGEEESTKRNTLQAFATWLGKPRQVFAILALVLAAAFLRMFWIWTVFRGRNQRSDILLQRRQKRSAKRTKVKEDKSDREGTGGPPVERFDYDEDIL